MKVIYPQDLPSYDEPGTPEALVVSVIENKKVTGSSLRRNISNLSNKTEKTVTFDENHQVISIGFMPISP